MFDFICSTARRLGNAVARAANSAKNFVVGGLALGGASLVASNAHASVGGSLSAEAISKITGLESDVQSILVILVGVVFLFVLYSFIKRAK